MTPRDLTATEVAHYQRHGVVLVKHAITSNWVNALNQVVDYQLAHPSQWVNDSQQTVLQTEGSSKEMPQEAVSQKQETPKERLFTDRYLWRDNATIHDFVHHSGCAKLAAQAMQSETSRFYFDHLLVKEPGTKAATPWHQDIPYWPFQGTQVCSIWVALTPSTIEGSALEFVQGSHLGNKYYKALPFGEKNAQKAWIGESQSEPVPDIDNNRDLYDIVGWDVEPGDALIFSAWTLHGARGNASSNQRRAAISTRWLGDNAIWQPHKGADPTVKQQDVAIQPGEAPHDDNVFPLIWCATK